MRYYSGWATGTLWVTLQLSDESAATNGEAWRLFGPFDREQADHTTVTLNSLERTYASNPSNF